MNLEEHLRDAREILDDRELPYLFSDEELVRRYNDAVSEACIRTRVIQDSSSQAARIALSQGQATYALDPSIFAVRRARVSGERDPLELVDVSQLDAHCSGWDDPIHARSGTPRYAMFDGHTGRITLVPTPASSGTLALLVWRGPAEDERFEAGDLTAEAPIPEHMHRELKHWVCGQVLLNLDSEQRNSALAAEQLALFEQAYGRKPDLHEIRLWSTNKRRRVSASFD